MNRLSVVLIVLAIVSLTVIFYQHISKFLTSPPVKQTEIKK